MSTSTKGWVLLAVSPLLIVVGPFAAELIVFPRPMALVLAALAALAAIALPIASMNSFEFLC